MHGTRPGRGNENAAVHARGGGPRTTSGAIDLDQLARLSHVWPCGLGQCTTLIRAPTRPRSEGPQASRLPSSGGPKSNRYGVVVQVGGEATASIRKLWSNAQAVRWRRFYVGMCVGGSGCSCQEWVGWLRASPAALYAWTWLGWPSGRPGRSAGREARETRAVPVPISQRDKAPTPGALLPAKPLGAPGRGRALRGPGAMGRTAFTQRPLLVWDPTAGVHRADERTPAPAHQPAYGTSGLLSQPDPQARAVVVISEVAWSRPSA